MMNSKRYHWMVVFEMIIGMPVSSDDPKDEQPPAMHLVGQKWTRSGDVDVVRGRPTDSVIEEIVRGCKNGGGVPDAAMLIGCTFNPMFLNGE